MASGWPMPMPEELWCFIPLLLFLICVDLIYFSRPGSSRYATFSGPAISAKVKRDALQEFRGLRRNLVLMVMDLMGILGLLLLALYILRMLLFGKESLSPDELYHTYALVVWQSICALFHSGLVPFGDRDVTVFLYAFNLCTLSLGFSPQAKSLESFLNIGRILGSIIFLDFRHALGVNVLFTARKLSTLQRDWMAGLEGLEGLEAPDLVQEVCVTLCVLTIPYSIEKVALHWISMALAHTDLQAALQAARTVITSTSDAQGELDHELKLVEVSAKLASLLGCTPSDLEGQPFLELMQEDDRKRCRNVLRLASETSAEQGQPVPHTLNISIGKKAEDMKLQICSSSFPRGGSQYFLYFFAITKVQETVLEEADEEEPIPMHSSGSAGGSPSLTEQVLAAHKWATPSQSCSSFYEVKVSVDEATLEVLNVQVILNTNHWKQSRKTFLHECILPAAWDGLRSWMRRSLKGHKGDPPFIVPFGFPRIMGAIACARHVDLKRKVGVTGRSELSLRLKHIFVRRPATTAPLSHRGWTATQSL